MTEDSVTITENYTAPQVSTGDQDSLSCLKPSVRIQNIFINSNNPYSIIWSTDIGTIDAGLTIADPAVSAAGDYTITVTDNTSGCVSTATVFVGESDDFGFDVNQLAFPNIITPNGDAYNTSWRPFSALDRDMDISKVFSLYDLKVFDRWGKTVFESKQFNNQWDAKELGEGTYFYIFQYESYCSPGSAREIQGYIFVARN